MNLIATRVPEHLVAPFPHGAHPAGADELAHPVLAGDQQACQIGNAVFGRGATVGKARAGATGAGHMVAYVVIVNTKKTARFDAKKPVEQRGIEPLTSAMRTRRSPN